MQRLILSLSIIVIMVSFTACGDRPGGFEPVKQDKRSTDEASEKGKPSAKPDQRQNPTPAEPPSPSSDETKPPAEPPSRDDHATTSNDEHIKQIQDLTGPEVIRPEDLDSSSPEAKRPHVPLGDNPSISVTEDIRQGTSVEGDFSSPESMDTDRDGQQKPDADSSSEQSKANFGTRPRLPVPSQVNEDNIREQAPASDSIIPQLEPRVIYSIPSEVLNEIDISSLMKEINQTLNKDLPVDKFPVEILKDLAQNNLHLDSVRLNRLREILLIMARIYFDKSIMYASEFGQDQPTSSVDLSFSGIRAFPDQSLQIALTDKNDNSKEEADKKLFMYGSLNLLTSNLAQKIDYYHAVSTRLYDQILKVDGSSLFNLFGDEYVVLLQRQEIRKLDAVLGELTTDHRLAFLLINANNNTARFTSVNASTLQNNNGITIRDFEKNIAAKPYEVQGNRIQLRQIDKEKYAVALLDFPIVGQDKSLDPWAEWVMDNKPTAPIEVILTCRSDSLIKDSKNNNICTSYEGKRLYDGQNEVEQFVVTMEPLTKDNDIPYSQIKADEKSKITKEDLLSPIIKSRLVLHFKALDQTTSDDMYADLILQQNEFLPWPPKDAAKKGEDRRERPDDLYYLHLPNDGRRLRHYFDLSSLRIDFDHLTVEIAAHQAIEQGSDSISPPMLKGRLVPAKDLDVTSDMSLDTSSSKACPSHQELQTAYKLATAMRNTNLSRVTDYKKMLTAYQQCQAQNDNDNKVRSDNATYDGQSKWFRVEWTYPKSHVTHKDFLLYFLMKKPNDEMADMGLTSQAYSIERMRIADSLGNKHDILNPLTITTPSTYPEGADQ